VFNEGSILNDQFFVLGVRVDTISHRSDKSSPQAINAVMRIAIFHALTR
jgi:hypothetical protein